MNAELQASEKLLPPASSPTPDASVYRSRLSAFLATWRNGLMLSGILKIAAIFLVALLVYALLDYYLALGSQSRLILEILLVAGITIALIGQIVAVFRLGREDIARRVDSISARRRKPVLSALELLKEKSPDSKKASDLHEYLVDKSVVEANSTLQSLTWKSVFPSTEFRKSGIRFLIIGLAFLLLFFALRPMATVLLSRIATPWEDIPPYSPLAFAVSPEMPEIFYGDDATVTVEISGAPLTEPVRFLTRDGDKIFETVCFQDGPNRFAQKLERVVKQTEFAFAHGKARSHWHNIDLLLEPKIAIASVTVTPPEYANLPEKTFLIGEEPLAALRGSRVKLAVTSNRPLTAGEATLYPVGKSSDQGNGIEGKKTALQTVTFEWEVEDESNLEIEIRDVRGSPNREPFLISQKLIPDKAPEISIEKPPVHLMATPSISFPVEARAEDDLGLDRVDLVRTVVGYRDRLENITPGGHSRRLDYDTKMDLSTLGVRPGETIELYFQATDRNPSLAGIAASEVARVQIISDEEYASIIRSRTTVREFADRFRVVNESLDELSKAMEELARAQESGDTEAIDKARQKAAEAAARASSLFDLLSKDFAAFDLENSAIEGAAQTLLQIRKMQKTLQESTPSPEALARMLEALGRQQQQYQEQQKAADEVAAVSEVMEIAAQFSKIVRDQDALTRRLKQFEMETRSAHVPFLQALGKDQDVIKEQLENFENTLGEKISQLPAQYETLSESARAFLTEVEKARADLDMKTSIDAAGNEDGSRSYQYSSLALEKLNALLNQEGDSEAFGKLCEGQMQFPVPGNLERTLSQMLGSICLRSGSGNEPGVGGGGVGMGGDSNDGYSMAGYSALDIPVIGPQRMRLDYQSNSRISEDNTESNQATSNVADAPSESDRFENATSLQPTASPVDFDRVPEKYRDAVKRYFTYENENDSQQAIP